MGFSPPSLLIMWDRDNHRSCTCISRGILCLHGNCVEPVYTGSHSLTPQIKRQVASDLPVWSSVASAHSSYWLVTRNRNYPGRWCRVAVVCGTRCKVNGHHLVIWRPEEIRRRRQGIDRRCSNAFHHNLLSLRADIPVSIIKTPGDEVF